MPSALMLTEDALPKYNERDNDEQRLKDIYSYLFMLVEQLRYSLGNLGASNFNETELNLIGEGITEELDGEVDLITKALVGETGSIAQILASGDALYARIANAEGKATEAIATLDGLQFKVTNGEQSSTLQLFSGATVLSSAKIQITGMVTFLDLQQTGKTQINGANITTGTISAIDINGCNITMYYDSDYGDESSLSFVWGKRQVGGLGFSYDPNVSDDPYIALASDFGMNIHIDSDNEMYINSEEGMFINAAEITLRAEDVYIYRPTLYDVNNGAWTFSREGIKRNGVLHFPI